MIAFIKMSLVVLFFMHVKYTTGLTRIVIFGGFFWLGIMMTFMLPTSFPRNWTPTVSQAWNTILPVLASSRRRLA